MANLKWMTSFKRKVQLLLVGFAVLLMVCVLFAVRAASLATVRDKIERDFEQLRPLLAQQAKLRMAALDDALGSGLGDSLFRSQLAEASAKADTGLEEEGPALAETHGVFESADLPIIRRFAGFSVLNAEGLLVFSKAAPHKEGDDLSKLSLLQGNPFAVWDDSNSLLVPAGGPYLVLAKAVRSGERSYGHVIVAEALSDFLAQLERASGAYVGIIPTGGQAAANDEHSKELAAQLAAATEQPTAVKLQGERYLALASPIEANGEVLARVVFVRSIEAEVARLMRRLDLALLVALLLSLAISWPAASLLARRLTVPLSELERAARQLERGDFAAHAHVTSDDEVGRVGRAFNEMMVALRERSVDRLTGAYNRRYFLNALDAALLRSDALGAPVSLVLIDVDHFRAYNAKHGREAGDTLLKGLARLAHEHCRRDDVLARYADDELILLLQDTDARAAETIAQKLVAGAQGYSITASVVCRSTRLNAAHDLLRAADRALYDAKSGARGRAVMAA